MACKKHGYKGNKRCNRCGIFSATGGHDLTLGDTGAFICFLILAAIIITLFQYWYISIPVILGMIWLSNK